MTQQPEKNLHEIDGILLTETKYHERKKTIDFSRVKAVIIGYSFNVGFTATFDTRFLIFRHSSSSLIKSIYFSN